MNSAWPPTIPASDNIRRGNARVPLALTDLAAFPADADGLACVDIAIEYGAVAGLAPVGAMTGAVDLDGGQVWPGFVDMHTHLDKAHIWPRSPNADGRFTTALQATAADRKGRWTVDDIKPRFDFALRCAYAHGTVAIRTHIDSFDFRFRDGWRAFREMRDSWAGRIAIQAASIIGIDAYMTDHGREVADTVAASGGVLGAVTTTGTAHGDLPADFDAMLDRLFELAAERGLSLDLHVDESGHSGARALLPLARAAIRHGYQGKVVCGHCCSLARQPDDVVMETIEACAEASVAVVSLPMCNMYLQDREPGRTPRWRGVTLLHELAASGIDVAVASDNCRDPFYAFGDLDMLEVFSQAVRIAHLDNDYPRWVRAASATPASVMGLKEHGTIKVGAPADLMLFRARSMVELLSRPQADRVVLRRGRRLDERPPDYRELDAYL